MEIFFNSFSTLVYYRRGPNKWRDFLLPCEILENWCREKNFPDPEWSPDHMSVVIDGTQYTLDQFGECRLINH